MDPFLHSLYQKHYANRQERKLREVCVRCGGKGVLGLRRPFLGLCKKCRKLEWKSALCLALFMITVSLPAFAGTASWYDSKSVQKEGTCHAEKCYTASGKEIHSLESSGTLFCAAPRIYRIGTSLKVTDHFTGRSVTVAVLDRGGFARHGRSIDLCKAAFERISSSKKGLTEVTIQEVL
jgi:rare lipoprotein A